MEEIEVKTIKWGNSLGIVIPKEIVEREQIRPGQKIKLFLPSKKIDLSKIFGTLKFKESAQKMKDEARKGWGG